ncbi:alpha/beta fold hydrolase [Chloroflexota bacterium]
MKLIFIHGSGNTGLVWHYQTRHFADSEAISFPGHPEGNPCSSIEDYAEWLHKYVLEEGYSELVLAGHSMGGAVAQMYALNNPQYVKGLILIGTGARLRVRPDFLSLMEAGIEAPDTWIKNSVEPFYSRVDPAVRDKVINEVADVGARVQLKDFRCCDEFDIMDRVHQIAAPTLVICGTEDEMTPVKYSQYLSDKIAGARMVIIEGGSHFIFMEKPEEVNRAVGEFLRGL